MLMVWEIRSYRVLRNFIEGICKKEMLLVTQIGVCQPREVKGVGMSNRFPLSDVIVVVKGTTTRTQTNFARNFTITM